MPEPVRSVRIIDQYKSAADVLRTKCTILLQLRYQILVIVITILSASLGLLNLMINSFVNPTYKLNEIYLLLILWLVFAIILLFGWRYFTHPLHKEEFGYYKDMSKYVYLVNMNKIEDELTLDQRQEMETSINNVPMDPGIKKYDGWVFKINVFFFSLAVLFLILNFFNVDFFYFFKSFAMTPFGIVTFIAIGLGIFYFYLCYKKNQNF